MRVVYVEVAIDVTDQEWEAAGESAEQAAQNAIGHTGAVVEGVLDILEDEPDE